MKKAVLCILTAALVLVAASCAKKQPARNATETARADSLMEVAHLAHDNDRIPVLARTLARRLGGDVILDTSYSFGARFVFSLPV